MSRYKFSIEAYFTECNHLEIEDKEKELFEIEGKKILLKSLNEKNIKESNGIKIVSEYFDKIDDCVRIAKKCIQIFC